jgi:hypothetical protein
VTHWQINPRAIVRGLDRSVFHYSEQHLAVTRIVRIDSFLNRPLAEFAQLQLKAAAIDSRLENATLIAWFWPLGFAVGGIKLFVKEEDAAQAHEILALPDAVAPQSPEFCPHCGEPLIPGWDTCWQCAPAAPAMPIDFAAAFNPSEDANEQMLLGVGAAAIGLIVFMACGPIWLLVVVASMGVVHLLFEFGAPEGQPVNLEEAKPIASDGQPARLRQGLVEEIARRAWRAALFSLTYFPPLALCAVYLALRLHPRKVSLSAAGRARRVGALVVGCVMLFLCLLLIGAIVSSGLPTGDLRSAPLSVNP